MNMKTITIKPVTFAIAFTVFIGGIVYGATQHSDETVITIHSDTCADADVGFTCDGTIER